MIQDLLNLSLEISENLILQEIQKARENFPGVRALRATIDGEIYFIGDLHGDFESLLRIMGITDFLKKIEAGKSPFLIFLGDYIDRGKNNIKTVLLLLALYNQYPKNIFLLQGNHEEEIEYPKLGKESKDLFGTPKVYFEFIKAANKMPTMLVVNNTIVAAHAGVSSETVHEWDDFEDEEVAYQMRWNDPIGEPSRGMFMFPFTSGALNHFLQVADAKILITGHRLKKKGAKQYFRGKMLSIISCGGPSKDIVLKKKVAFPKIFRWQTGQPVDLKGGLIDIY